MAVNPSKSKDMWVCLTHLISFEDEEIEMSQVKQARIRNFTQGK